MRISRKLEEFRALGAEEPFVAAGRVRVAPKFELGASVPVPGIPEQHAYESDGSRVERVERDDTLGRDAEPVQITFEEMQRCESLPAGLTRWIEFHRSIGGVETSPERPKRRA